ncbi:hypothetical protein NQ318_023045 [Aromia moschata]|uniref:Stimulator of interferon genes protein n=1 Tax=Aromia moschata TaxID=1265417 RepID=A0AAV8XXV0_9CUCU|nr:hypothetical protein NQ318_023045 [Aromia moschata]
MSEAENIVASQSAQVNLKNLCVLQRGNKFYYPRSIPQERGPLVTKNRSGYCGSDLITNDNKKTSVIALYCLALLISIVLQLLYRSVLVLEELNHLQSRYSGSYANLLKNAFHLPVKCYIALFALVLYTLYYFVSNDWFSEFEFSFKRITLLLVPSIYLIGILLELNVSPLNDSLWIAKDNGLDYGSGMAYSFFYGYLNLVLPKTGTQEKNLKELMQDYEDQNDVHFAVYKLFILIPKSLTCTVSLKNENSPSIDESSSLPPKTITVAGVQDRVYKNAVYKIISEKTQSKIYVSAEFATPLKTFKDVFNRAGDHSDFYKDQDNQICYYDVGKIILTRLRELKKQREKTD